MKSYKRGVICLYVVLVICEAITFIFNVFKYTKARLELLTDLDMYIGCEKALRGGVCAVSQRRYKANNPRVAGHDASKPTTWLRYDDANNLYGWAMSQKLPMRDFQY